MNDNIVSGNILTSIGNSGYTSQLQHGITFFDDSVLKYRNKIIGNTINGVQGRGIHCEGFIDSEISNNTLFDVDIEQLSAWNQGIYLLSSENNLIANNSIIDGVAGKLTYGIYEDTNCSGNRFKDNFIQGSIYPYWLTSTTSSISIDSESISASLTGTYTFKPGEARIYLIDPNGNRNFNPVSSVFSGVFPMGYEVVLINTADGAETITFDPNGLNQVVAQNECGIFIFDGSNWRKVYVGQ